jgi:dTDP-glucose pyrophosphorylase
MYCIIPLAGPDFIMPDGTLRPLYPVNNKPLLIEALNSREWVKSGELKSTNMIFVLRATEKTTYFNEFLKKEFSGCKVVAISHLTSGALLSALAGGSQITNFKIPVCIDLVDILYTCNFSPAKCFDEMSDLAGVIPYFISDNEKFSYLEIKDGFVTRTIEKVKISGYASAGTYFFKDLPTFLDSISGSLRLESEVTYKEMFFLCPAYNALIQSGRQVKAFEVQNVVPVSEYFHL